MVHGDATQRIMLERFFYVYVLKSKKDNQLYVGSTNNLEKRIKRHQRGLVSATRNRLPMELIFYEAYQDKFDALRREDYFKSTKGKRTLRLMLSEYFHKSIEEYLI